MTYSGGIPSGSKVDGDPLWTGSFSTDPGKNTFPGNVFPGGSGSDFSLYSPDGPTITRNIFTRYNYTLTSIDQTPFGFAGGTINSVRTRGTEAAGGGGGSGDPLDISGCTLWLDADDASSITLNGTDVEEWRNKSTDYAGIFDYRQDASTIRQPAYVLSALNSKSVVRFDRIWDYMSASGNASKRSPAGTDQTFTAFLVARENAAATGGYGILQWGLNSSMANTSDSSWIFLNNYGASSRYMAVRDLNNYIISTDITGKMLATARIFTLTQTSTNTTYHVTGTLNATAAATIGAAYPATSTNTFSFLGTQYAASTHFYGDIAEIIVYNRDLSTSERGTIESYLSTKWGVAIS